MADFDAILRKALASRPEATGEERRKIYERARQALIRQLTSFEPPLPPEDISRQRLALESAIRKVEAEAASRAFGGTRPTPMPAPTPSRATEAVPAQAPTPEHADSGDLPGTPSRPAADDVPAAPMPRAEPVFAPAPVAPVAAKAQAVVPVEEPIAAARPVAAEQPLPEPDGADLPDFEPERSQPMAPAPRARKSGRGGLFASLAVLVLVAGGGIYAWQSGILDAYLPQQDAGGETVGEQAAVAPDVRQVGGTDPTRSTERILPDNQGTAEEPLTPPAAPEAEAEAGQAPVELAPETPAEAAPAETETAAAPPAQTLPVSQSAVLYEEGLTADSPGFSAPGRTIWRLDDGDGVPVNSGTVEVPNRGLSIDMRISRNTDDALPATHLIEFTFNLGEAFPAEGVSELVGVVVKPEEQAGGDPLRGAIVDLGGGTFWQALSAGEADRAINLPLLRDGRWFDLPVLYADNRRAIISFEKGEDGARVFQQALEAWSN